MRWRRFWEETSRREYNVTSTEDGEKKIILLRNTLKFFRCKKNEKPRPANAIERANYNTATKSRFLMRAKLNRINLWNMEKKIRKIYDDKISATAAQNWSSDAVTDIWMDRNFSPFFRTNTDQMTRRGNPVLTTRSKKSTIRTTIKKNITRAEGKRTNYSDNLKKILTTIITEKKRGKANKKKMVFTQVSHTWCVRARLTET